MARNRLREAVPGTPDSADSVWFCWLRIRRRPTLSAPDRRLAVRRLDDPSPPELPPGFLIVLAGRMAPSPFDKRISCPATTTGTLSEVPVLAPTTGMTPRA